MRNGMWVKLFQLILSQATRLYNVYSTILTMTAQSARSDKTSSSLDAGI